MENQINKKMEHETETGGYLSFEGLKQIALPFKRL